MSNAADLALTVNGEPTKVPEGSSIADVVGQLVGGGSTKGIAVAVERAVIPRSAWKTTPAVAGSRIEVVTASAGG